MATTQPIKNLNQIQQLKNYFWEKGNLRDYLLIVMGLNTSLRISDILHICWKDVYNFESEKYREHITLVEQKTGKTNMIVLNSSILEALKQYQKNTKDFGPDYYLFKSRKGNNSHIGRTRAFTIIKEAVHELGLEENISCHSLRKTFGYQAWKRGIPPVLLMSIYNHSSYEITKRYLGISQEEQDQAFLEMPL